MKKLFALTIMIFVFTSTLFAKTVWRDIAADVNSREFNCVAVDATRPQIVYVGTANGAFKTTNGGEDWQQIYKGWGARKKVRQILIGQGIIYLCTDGGLLISKNGGKRWAASHGAAARSMVRSIAILSKEEPKLFIATSQGLFKAADGERGWRPISTQSLGKEIIEDWAEEEELGRLKIRCVAASRLHPKRLYIGTEDGVYLSDDGCRSMERITDEGLLEKSINFVAESLDGTDRLYSVTKNGVYYLDAKWHLLDLSRYFGEPRSIAFDRDPTNSMWVATEKGVFKSAESASDDKIEEFETSAIYNYFNDEPSVQEVQEEAIEYAEVHPYKIASWRTRANISAVMPRLSFGIDNDSSDGLHWDSGQNPDRWVVGPENESTGWDITFTWDLSKLIWNGAQTLIDVRSKLMVQLRDDILDEATSYYYERRRLQIELLEAPPKNMRTRIKKELRVQELTANLDALTGGYFSKQLESE
jgi:ligand-binding sensor domain-containing protein